MALTVPLQPATYTLLDLFPAAISGPTFTAQHEEYRAVVTDTYIYALDDGPDGPFVAFSAPVSGFAGSNKEGYTVNTPDGIYTVYRAPNCGCGSRLRGVRLTPTVPRAPRK